MYLVSHSNNAASWQNTPSINKPFHLKHKHSACKCRQWHNNTNPPTSRHHLSAAGGRTWRTSWRHRTARGRRLGGERSIRTAVRWHVLIRRTISSLWCSCTRFLFLMSVLCQRRKGASEVRQTIYALAAEGRFGSVLLASHRGV